MSCIAGVEALRHFGTVPLVDVQSIEVFADIWCPFAHVGLQMIDAYRKQVGREDVVIVVKAWPLEWVNNSPMDPARTQGNCMALREQVAPELFSNVDFGNFPKSTLGALGLVAQAYELDPRRGEKASFAIRSALFEKGADISQSEVLVRIAQEIGLEYEPDPEHRAVKREWEEGRARGVQGSPHFFHGEDGVFCPSLQISKSEEVGLQVHADTARLKDFLHSCFAVSKDSTL